MSTTTLTKTVFFAHPREKVWSYLTQKDKLALWFHPADANLEQGKDYALMKTNDEGAQQPMCWGHVEVMEPPTKLVYTFTFQHLAGQFTTVTWHLESIDGGTKLTLHHEGIAAAAGAGALNMLMSLDAGWDDHIAALRKAI